MLRDAETNAACQASFRIQINAYTPPLNQLANASSVTQSYIDALNKHFETLTQYYDLIRSDVLQEIIATKAEFSL